MAHTQDSNNRISEKFLTLAVLLVAFLISFSGARAQSTAAWAASESSDSSTCWKMYYLGDEYATNGNPKMAQDTLEHFIDECYAQKGSWKAFAILGGAVGGAQDTNNEKWLAYREWLFSVLYLNPDTMYYCEDASSLLGTFNYFEGPRGFDQRGELAVVQYILNSGKCPNLRVRDSIATINLWRAIHTHWLDTVTDSLATPFDSALPMLQQIGFEILLGPQYALEHNGVIPTSALGEIGVSPNPFADRTEISYTMNVPATLTV